MPTVYGGECFHDAVVAKSRGSETPTPATTRKSSNHITVNQENMPVSGANFVPQAESEFKRSIAKRDPYCYKIEKDPSEIEEDMT